MASEAELKAAVFGARKKICEIEWRPGSEIGKVDLSPYVQEIVQAALEAAEPVRSQEKRQRERQGEI